MSKRVAPILGIRTFFREFFRRFPQHIQYKTKSPKDFTRIIKQFHSDFTDAVINNRYGADLPLKYGNIRIVSYKKNREYLNQEMFDKEGIVTGFSNNHTNGLCCKIQYRNKGNKYKFKDKVLWAFFADRPFKKKVSKAFRENYQKYIFSPNRGQINKKANIFNWKVVNDSNIEKFLLDYNEFEM